MGLIIQQRALQAAGGLRAVLPVVRKRDRSLFDQMHRAMNSVVLNIAEADGNDAGNGQGSVRVGMWVGQGGPGRAPARRRVRLPSKLEGHKGGHRAR